MFYLGANKNFMDSVHGYISIPKCFVENIIDTEWFQRLRNIDQTGMKVLYPNAKHDRFSHSLGVFYLAQKAMDSLLEKSLIKEENQEFCGGDNFDGKIDKLFWLKNKVLFLIACLLHDIGHTPYSHSLESLVLENSKFIVGNGKLKRTERVFEYLENIFLQYEVTNEDEINLKDKISKAAPHEQLSSLLVFEQFKQAIKTILIEVLKLNSIEIEIESKDIEKKIEESIEDDLCFVSRMIMGIKYNAWQKERQIRNCLIELLNGSNFDVDKLDYIIRDTQMSGISNVAVDAERLLSSLCIITKTKMKDKELTDKKVKNFKATIIKNNKNNEILIKGNIHGKIAIDKNSVVHIYKNSQIELLKNYVQYKDQFDENAKIKLVSGNQAIFSAESEVKKNNEIVSAESVEPFNVDVKQLYENSKKHFTTTIAKAKVLKDFKFLVIEKLELELSGYCEIKIKGEFKTVGPVNISDINALEGNISEIEVFGNAFYEDYKNKKELSEKDFNTFSIGFKKQAINCVASVLDARNYLYLWIYAHHKVIYYANFLIPVLSEKLSQFVCNKERKDFPNWILGYKNIRFLDDSYVWTAFKYLREIGNLKKENKILCDQLFLRKYYFSLYKSLAEFDSCFETFSNKAIRTLFQELTKKISSKLPAVSQIVDGQQKLIAGYLKKIEIDEINKLILNTLADNQKKIQVEKLIFVPAAYKLKTLDTTKVYIDMGHADIVPVNLISLLNNSERKVEKNERKYFYIYYGLSNDSIVDKNTNEIVRKCITEHFKKLIKLQ